MNPDRRVLEAAVAAHREALHEAGEALLAYPLDGYLPLELDEARVAVARTRARLVQAAGLDPTDDVTQLLEEG